MSELKKFLAKVLIVLVVITIVMAIFHGARFFLLLFAGALIAILWRGVARWISNKTGARFKIILPILIFLNIGLIVLFFVLAWPNISTQAGRLAEEIPKVVEQVQRDMYNTKVGKKLLEGINENGFGEDQMKKVFDVFSGSLNFLVDIFLITAFALFLTADPHLYRRGMIALVPSKYVSTTNHLLDRLHFTFFRWFLGKIVDMFSIFVMTTIGLILLDMPMVFTFALIAFFFSFVPNIGPVISAIPPIAIALLDSPQKALYVGLLYLGIQLVESYFITPKVQKKASFTPPVLLLLVQFLMARFLGVLGLFLATPVLILLTISVKKLYVENYLNKENKESPSN